ncbi:MAG: stealth family protein [Clostridia bacterium]|nr:stealth family protein [Clostridia bacterium]
MDDKIDIVITWVDGSDEKWLELRNQYSGNKSSDNGMNRYRDFGTLKYLFRSIEKFAPWVNKVFLVTCDQAPEWLNRDNPKLCLVNHSDYIPEKYLPTFSSHPIEFNFHRIEGLAEHFIVCNDDCLFINPIDKEDFFVDGKPVDILTEFPLQFKPGIFTDILYNNFKLISKYYPNRSHIKKQLKKQYLSPVYGYYFFYNLFLYFLPYKGFIGLNTPHIMRPYTKSMFQTVWDKEYELLDSTCSHKFRSSEDVNIYIIRMLNMLNGNFVPGNINKLGKAIEMMNDDEAIYSLIESKKYKTICLNDSLSDECFDVVFEKTQKTLNKLLGDKSSFEL